MLVVILKIIIITANCFLQTMSLNQSASEPADSQMMTLVYRFWSSHQIPLGVHTWHIDL